MNLTPFLAALFTIVQAGNKWQVWNKDKTKLLAEFESQEKALDYLRAVEANKDKATTYTAPRLFYKGKPATFQMPKAPMFGGRLALVPIIPTGEFYRSDLGHFAISKGDLMKLASNARERSDLIQIDYNHSAFKTHDPNSKKAAGWIDRRSLFLAPWGRGFLLMGWGWFTGEASRKRSNGELLYISPSIVRGRREIARPGAPAGVDIGWSLVNVGLVDVPFFDMPPVALFNKSGHTTTRPLLFGGVVMEEMKTALANYLATLGVAADLIPAAVEGLMQLYMQAHQTMTTPAPAAPAAAPAQMAAPAAAPVAASIAAATPAAPAAFAAFPWPQQAPNRQLFNWSAPHVAALQLPNGQRVVAPVQVAPLPQQPAPQTQAQQPDPNVVALFGAVQQLSAQVAQIGQLVSGQQLQAAEANGQTAALQWAGLNPAQVAQQAPQLFNQVLQQAPAFAGPVAFSPMPRPVVPNQFGALGALTGQKQNKGAQLLSVVQTYRDKQAQSGRTLDYSTAMSEARSFGLLNGLE